MLPHLCTIPNCLSKYLYQCILQSVVYGGSGASLPRQHLYRTFYNPGSSFFRFFSSGLLSSNHQDALSKHLLTCVGHSQDEYPTKALLLRDSLFQGTCTFRQTRCPLVFYGPSLSEAEASSQPLQWYERELCHDPHLQMRELAMCYGLICVPPSSNVEVLTSSTSEGDLVWR